MRTERGFERLLFFSDAVVAIAMTLLVLPLVDIPRDAPKGASVADILSDNGFELLAFVIGFLVIGVFWRSHHALFEHLQAYDNRIMQLNQLWLFTIVVLPFTTELINGSHDSRLADALYIGNLLLSSLCLSGMSWSARRNPALRSPESTEDDDNPIDAPPWITSSILAVALALALAVPRIGLFSLLLLRLADPARWAVRRIRARR